MFKYQSSFALICLLLTNNLLSQNNTKIKDSQNLSLTIYNNNLAMVNEQRLVNIKEQGKQTLIYEGIPSSVIFESIIPSFEKKTLLYSQNYRYDILSLNKLLQKHINKEVQYKVYTSLFEYKKEKAILLSLNPILLKKNKEIIAGIKNSDIIFNAIPEDLITKPSLLWKTKSQKGLQKIQLNYLTKNISWRSDYILNLDDKNSLNAWITIKNNSGTSYKNADIYVIAGQVNQHIKRPQLQKNYEAKIMRLSAAVHMDIKEKAFSGYHLYKIPFKEDIYNKEQKQINFINKKEVKVLKKASTNNAIYFHRFRSIKAQNLNQVLELTNSKEQGLGLPLPKGTIRVYKKDEELSHFIGESSISHTALDNKIVLTIGKYFDITQDIIQAEFKQTKRYVQSKYSRTIKNKSNKKRTIEIKEDYYSSNAQDIEVKHNCKNICSFKQEGISSFIYTIEMEKDSSYTLETKYELDYAIVLR